MPIGVNLRSNVVRDCCLTLRFRSPLAPLKKGGTRVFSKSPFLRGIEGDLDLAKSEISQGFQS
jgi:hypothetical protein